ncbi:MAG: hypothetical protein LBC75_02440 [Fibromonadaceae bacterium]|jgi:hypothetical protein|nr:hypothetical protein [Fibromonadaceae bacterium]
MNRKMLAVMAFAIVALSLNACSSTEDKDDVFLLNKGSVKKQIEASDNGYCPLLPYPYDPRAAYLFINLPYQEESTIEHPDGSVEWILKNPDGGGVSERRYKDGSREGWVGGPDFKDPDYDFYWCLNSRENEEAIADSLCSNFSEARIIESLQKIYAFRKAYDSLAAYIKEKRDAWKEEVERVRSDPTRTAAVTFSKKQTIINLNPVFVAVDLKWVRLEGTQKNDTLYINAVPDKNGSYDSIGTSDCPISLDIGLDYIIGENIKVVVFEKYQIFQVKRQ